MPTIDQLSPASVAADTDQILVSQNGTARKLTRAQMLDGMQPEIALTGPRLLGRASPGTGAPEPVALGPGLSLASGTLSLTATAGDIASLPAGTVPTGPELVPISQNGGDVSVTYGQFLSGLPNVANVSASNMTVKAAGSTATQKMADFAANTLPKSGGQMSGPLVLAAAPFLANQATTKQYTDAADAARLLKAGDTMTGPLILQADPVTALGAATRQYADTAAATRVLKAGDSMTGKLNLPSMKVFQFGGGVTDPILRAQIAGSSPTTPGVSVIEQQTTHGGGTAGQVFPMQLFALAVGNQYTNNVLTDGPADNRWAIGVTLHTESLRANGTNGVRSQHGTLYQHVVRLLPADGYPVGRRGSDLWNSWLVTQDRTNAPSSIGGALVGMEHDISANNRDDANLRFQRQVTIGAQIPLSQGGQALEWGYGDYWNSTTGGDNDAFFKVVTAIYAGYTVAGIDFSLGTGERANPYVDGVNRAAAIKMRAGQKIAFDGDGATGKTLGYNATAQELQYKANGQAVLRIADNGRILSAAGITVGTSVTVSGTAALAANSTNMGALVLCTGSAASYNITLPAANLVPAGVGFTFAVSGTGRPSLVAAAGNNFQFGPPTLVPQDRLHLVSDGVSQWVELFRSNPGNTHFTGPPVLPGYTVAALPAGMEAGAKAFASNGRKPAQGAGAGTGVEVFFDGTAWIAVTSGAAITA